MALPPAVILREASGSIRSAEGATTITIWGDVPYLGVGGLLSCAAAGIPVALFPVVASAGGQWPAAGAFAALAALGAAAGTGVALGWQQWAAARWRRRVVALVTPIVGRVAALAAPDSGDEERE